MPTGTLRDRGLVTGLDVIATPGLPVYCFAFIGFNHQVRTDLDVFAAALGHATRTGREIEVEFVPGPPDILNRISTVPTPGTQPPPPPPNNADGGLVEELSIQDAGASPRFFSYCTSTLIKSRGAAFSTLTIWTIGAWRTYMSFA